MTTRRDLLKGLIASAVAVQLPALPATAAEDLTDRLYGALITIQINDRSPDEVNVVALDNTMRLFAVDGVFHDLDAAQVDTMRIGYQCEGGVLDNLSLTADPSWTLCGLRGMYRASFIIKLPEPLV